MQRWLSVALWGRVAEDLRTTARRVRMASGNTRVNLDAMVAMPDIIVLLPVKVRRALIFRGRLSHNPSCAKLKHCLWFLEM